MGNDKQFWVEQDPRGQIIDIYMKPENIRPTPYNHLTTHVATANDIRFLVHMDALNRIVGASPPPQSGSPSRSRVH